MNQHPIKEIIDEVDMKLELERINDDLKRTRRLFVVFLLSVATWIAVIATTIHLIK